MTARETRRYEMLVRVQRFGDAHHDRFPESSVGGQAFASVAAAVAQLSGHAAGKMSGSREGTRARAMTREALMERLAAISCTARVMARTTPGIEDVFRLSRRWRLTDLTLLTTGRLFAKKADAFKERFIAYSLPPAFLEELRELVDHFEGTIRRCEAVWSDRVSARAELEAAFASGLAAIRELDVIVANLFRDDPIVMAVWVHERRVGTRARSKAALVTPTDTISLASRRSKPRVACADFKVAS